MLYYVTSNRSKITVAQKYLSPLSIEVEQKVLDLQEIQSESIEEIALHKANDAYQMLKHPLMVNDAAWHIPALNGFPGAYMKFINQWFTTDDILKLMEGKQNREVIYEEVFCYTDGTDTKTFVGKTSGTILLSPQGKGNVSWRLFSLSPTGKSIAKCWEEGIDPIENYSIWEEISEYFKSLSIS